MSTRLNPLGITQLTKKGAKLFRAIAEGAQYRKVTSDGYMDLTVECLYQFTYANMPAWDFSFCHYGEQNGDSMRDPEMLFLVLETEDGEWHIYPHMYQNDYAFGYYTESLDWSIPDTIRVNRPMQKDQAKFAEIWMKNLQEQGFVKAAAHQPMIEKLPERNPKQLLKNEC